jgi:hypothetical protein
MFGIRYSYSDNYYATDGEDRGCSARDDSIAFNASQGICYVHKIPPLVLSRIANPRLSDPTEAICQWQYIVINS